MDMTIGEMIEAYANFDKTREFYNLYKESVTVDLKVRYALTESYMQESSIDAILEGGDLWSTIKEWGVKAWEAIKKFFKNIWFHITRFFHSIFSRSDNWYKTDAAYKKTIKDAYSLAIRKTDGRRTNADEFFEEAVLAVARKLGFYNKSEKRISDKMPNSILGKLVFISKVASGMDPAAKKKAARQFDSKFGDSKDALDLLSGANKYINAANESGVGFKVDDKKIDPICEILGEKKVNDKIESIADLLNITYMICKPPLSVRVPEPFDVVIRRSEDLINRFKDKISVGSGTDKAAVEMKKASAEFAKLLERSSNYYVDIIVDARFDEKIQETGRKISRALRDVNDRSKVSYDRKDFESIHLKLDEPDNKRRRDSMLSDFDMDGYSSAGSAFRSDALDSNATELPDALRKISAQFSEATSGISLLVRAIHQIQTFRKTFSDGVMAALSNETVTK